MSFEPDRDQTFRYATFGVLGLTVVICLCYGLIFLNPNLNFMPGLKPIIPTVTVPRSIEGWSTSTRAWDRTTVPYPQGRRNTTAIAAIHPQAARGTRSPLQPPARDE